MVVTPVTALSETCLGVETSTFSCTSLPASCVSSVCFIASKSCDCRVGWVMSTQYGMQGQCRACGCCMRSLATGKVHTGNQLL